MDSKNFLEDVEHFDYTSCEKENLQYQDINKILSTLKEQQALPRKNKNPKTGKQSCNLKRKKIQQLECHKCKIKCLSKKDLIDHMKKHELEIHKCLQCKRAFVSKNSLSYHMKSHAGVKYECDICNRKFNDKSNMKKHRNIHLNIRKYKCSSCPKTFSDPSGFKFHLEKHAGVKFKCNFCHKSFANRQYLKMHIKHVHLKIDLKSLVCDTCPLSFKSYSLLEEHKNKVHLDKKYECDICQKVFYLRLKLKDHIVIHPGMHLKCTICNVTFNRKNAHSSHMDKHLGWLQCPHCPKQCLGKMGLRTHELTHKNNKLTCAECGQIFPKRISIINHITNCHTKEKKYTQRSKHTRQHSVREKKYECHDCGSKFVTKGSILDHILSKHLQEYIFPCDRCEFTSYSKRATTIHIYNHALMKYICKYCSEKFHDHETFKSHLKIHLGDNFFAIEKWKFHVKKFIFNAKYKCYTCGTSYKTRHGLKSHMHIHLGIRYKCQHCRKDFSCPQNLRKHQKTHNEYECFFCGKRFLKLSWLQRHSISMNHHVKEEIDAN